LTFSWASLSILAQKAAYLSIVMHGICAVGSFLISWVLKPKPNIRTVKKILQFTTDFDAQEAMILRDHLAMERTKLANERTLLSYIRTALYLLLAGLGLLGLENFSQLAWLGYVVLCCSALVAILGVLRFLQLRRHLARYYALPPNQNPKDSISQP
jgi:putative membrane protein